MTTKDKKRILNTHSVKGELRMRTVWNCEPKIYSFHCIRNNRSESACVMLVSNFTGFYREELGCHVRISETNTKTLELWQIIGDLGMFSQKIPFSEIEILHCIIQETH